METIVHNVSDLDQSDRSAFERLVGHRLGESQQLVIQVVGAVSDQPTVTELPDWCRVYDGLSDSEIDELDSSIVRTYSSRNIA